MSKKSKLFMAISTGKESTENGVVKRYIGVGSVFVKAVCPNKAQLEALYNTTLDNSPEYLGETEIGPEGSKQKVAQVRLDFIIQTDPEKNSGIDTSTKISFYLANSYRFNKDNSKVQIIDKYGRTAWATQEEVKGKTIPQYASGPANIDADYRPAYIGEEDLIGFIKAYLNIDNPQNYKDGKWVNKTSSEMANCEARLDKIPNYFKEDFKELNDLLSYQPNNKVKVLFGVKTTEDNKIYQTIYTHMFLRNGTTDYSRLDKDLKERKDAGAYSTVEFEVTPLKEYQVNPTDFMTLDMGGVVTDPFASVASPFAK